MNCDYRDDTLRVLRHDARDLPLEDGSVDLIVTSPPYFALRSYRDEGEHYGGQIGSEDTPDEFLAALDECMVEWGRVLKPSGSVWINLGDKYAGSQANSNWSSAPINHGAGVGEHERLSRQDSDLTNEPSVGFGHTRTKSLMGLPWRHAIRQIDAGWILRAEVVWSKPNGLPESVTDRVRRSHEQWFHFVREPRYFAAVDEIREPHAAKTLTHRGGGQAWGNDENPDNNWNGDGKVREPNPLGRLPGSVWTVPTEPLIIPDEIRQLRGLPDHFAAFPQEWPRKLILGWSPSGICTVCGEGRRPVVESTPKNERPVSTPKSQRADWDEMPPLLGARSGVQYELDRRIDGYACACPDDSAPTRPAVVLDPFGGTGTVAGVARQLGRIGIHNDLSADYNRLAMWRILESGHFTKTEQRTWADRQGALL